MKTKLLRQFREEADKYIWAGKNIGLGKQPYIIFKRIENTYAGTIISVKNELLEICSTKEDLDKKLLEYKRKFIIEEIRSHYIEGVKRI